MNARRPAIVWGLLLIIVMMSGLTAAPTVGHAQHHADHATGTHSTGICAWLCAGGVGVESSVVHLVSGLQLFEWIAIPSFDLVLHEITLPYFFRGPPRLLS
ncbi:MAG: hypothetical protein HOO98_16825 [Nitrospira sp.]|nr:hypothetical protein [Nitrospira sp.]TKB90587.1 MAG: hypothetical protein E8D40_12675 [Nitrospira sp.]